jgi:MFS family permease
MTTLLSAGARPVAAALVSAVLVAAAIGFAWPRLLPARARPAPIAAPHGLVLILAVLAAIMFLVEGAILDWGALLIVDAGLASSRQAGLGYTLFSAAMTVGRLGGDSAAARLGDGRIVVLGASVALAGFVLLLTAGFVPVAMVGFLLIGLGAANIVPVLFRLAGRQTVMPVGVAVAAITTAGYAGVLAGPAAVGFVSQAFGLPTAFWLLAVLTSFVPLGTRRVSRRLRQESSGLVGAQGGTPSAAQRSR